MPRIVIDTDAATLRLEDAGGERELPLYSTEAFEILSSQWVKVGWNQRYPYTFSWLGRPLIQLPEDLVRIQEVIWRVRRTSSSRRELPTAVADLLREPVHCHRTAG